MRVDDRIDTILAWPIRSDADRARVWRQLADLVGTPAVSPAQRAAALPRMAECAGAIPPEERARVASSCAGHAEPGGTPVDDAAGTDAGVLAPASQIVDLLARLDAFHAGRAEEGPRDRPWMAEEEPAEPRVVRNAAASEGPAPVVRGDALDRTIGLLRGPLHKVPHLLAPETLPTGELRAAAALVADRSVALADALDALELAVAMAGDGGLDTGALLVRLDAALQPLADMRGLRISFRVARHLPPVEADAQSVERMVTRLVGAIVSLARRGEHVVARLARDRADGRMLAFGITRPGRLLGRDERALFDPPPREAQADAPELALSFALRLVDRLARETGGRLTIHDDRIVLALPLREPQVRLDMRGG